jgi:hypothetical protein
VVSEEEPLPEELLLVPDELLLAPEELVLSDEPLDEPVVPDIVTPLATVLAVALRESAGSCPETSWTAMPSHAAANSPADQAATRRLIMRVRRSRASVRARPTAARSGTGGPAKIGEAVLVWVGVMMGSGPLSLKIG